MNQAEFETLVSSLASQYADACSEELAALQAETELERDVSDGEARIIYNAHHGGLISGSNKETRELQAEMTLLRAEEHQRIVTMRNLAVTSRKRATMVRVGVEHEMKLWRAWLASQCDNLGGNE